MWLWSVGVTSVTMTAGVHWVAQRIAAASTPSPAETSPAATSTDGASTDPSEIIPIPVWLTSGTTVIIAAAVVLGLILLVGLGGAAARKGGKSEVERGERRRKERRGLATPFQLWWETGTRLLLVSVKQMRPSMAKRSWWARLWVHWSEVGIRLCQVPGFAWWRLWTFITLEETAGVVGPQRSGKTAGSLANMVINAPGAVVTTSTKRDIVDQTRAARQTGIYGRRPWLVRVFLLLTGQGRKRWLRRDPSPVWILNADDIGDPTMRSTFRWDPVRGCEDPETAMLRSGDLILGSSSGGDHSRWWDNQGVRVLAYYLHAAAIGRRTVHEVAAWVNNRDASKRVVLDLLSKSRAGESWYNAMTEFVELNPNTASSITTTIAPALQWLNNPRVAEMAMPRDDDEHFDVSDFLDRRGTLYMLGEERPFGSVAPLFAAFVGELNRRARWLASKQPGGRLDPPLTMVLDEVAVICPLPLGRMLADSGSHGIPIILGFQNFDQMINRWGQSGARMIWGLLNAKMIFGGQDNPDELKMYADVFSHVDAEVEGKDGKSAIRSVEVVPTSTIRSLKKFRVFLIRRSVDAAFGRCQRYWRRPEVKAAWKEEANDLSTLPAWQPGWAGHPNMAAGPGPGAQGGPVTTGQAPQGGPWTPGQHPGGGGPDGR